MPFSSACFLHGSQPLTRPARALCAPRLPSFGQAASVDMRVWLEHRGWKAMDSPRDWLRRVLSAPPALGGGLWPGGCGGHRTKRGPCGLIPTRESALMALPSHHGHGGGLAAEPSPPGSPTLVLLAQAARGSPVTQALRVGESPADPGAWDLPQTRLGSHSGRRVGDETRAGPPGTLLASLTSAQEAKSWLLRRGLPWAGSGWGSGNQLRPQSCSFAEK